MILDFKANKKQWEAISYLLDQETTELGYGWWAGWWKSFLWVFWVRMMCQKYPWTRRFFWRKELKNLRITTLTSYYKFIAEYEIPEANKWKLNWQDNIIRFTNWSEILLLDMAFAPQDPLYTRFGSLELTWGFIDESNEIDIQAITIIKTRLGRQKNKEFNLKPKLLETFNPDKWHVYDRYYKPWKLWLLPSNRQFIPALATDNPHIDPNYIEQLKMSDEITKQRLLYWNFDYDDTQGKLFRYDEINDLFTNTIDKSFAKYLSCDIARLWNDSTVITYREWLDCKEIHKYHWLTTDQVAEKIKEFEADKEVSRYNIVVDSDWVGGWVADQLRWCYNFVNNSRPVKDLLDRENNFSNLKTQCYYKLKELAEKRKIRIRAEWEIRDNLTQELNNTMLKNEFTDQKIQLESKDEMKRRIWRSPDTSDAIMMRMYFELAKTWSANKTEIVTVNYDSLLY